MKKATLILIVLINSLFLNVLTAQTHKIDSLKNLLGQQTANDTIRINLLNELIPELLHINNNTVPKYAEESITLADKLNYKKGKAISLKLLGLYYSKKSNYNQALKYYNDALLLNKEIGSKKGISNCLNNIGNIYYDQNNYAKTLDFYQKSMKIDEELNDSIGIAISLRNIGLVYHAQSDSAKSIAFFMKSLKLFQQKGDKLNVSESYRKLGDIYIDFENYPEALMYCKKSLKLSEEIGDKKGISKALINLGNISYYLGDYSKTLSYYQKSMKISEAIGDRYGVALCLSNIGTAYQTQEDFIEALAYYHKSIKVRNETGDNFGICSLYNKLSRLYLKIGDLEKAKEHTLKGLKIAKKTDILEQQKDFYKQLSVIYETDKNYKKAYQNHVLYKELSDSVFNEENIKKITSLQLNYEFEKEKQAIKLEQQKKDAIIQKEIKYQKTIKSVLVLGLFVAGIIILLFFKIIRDKKNTNDLLRQKNEEISEKKNLIVEQKTELEIQTNELNRYKEHLEEIVKQRTTELLIEKERAEESDKLKTEFFHNMSHEIRTPLNGIIGFSGFLSSIGLTEEKKSQYINIIQRSGDQLMKIVDDILEISKLATKQVKIVEQKIYLNALLSELYSHFDKIAKEKGIVLYLKKEFFDTNCNLFTDKRILNNILINLLDNALKFTNDGFVEFGYHFKNKELEIYVKDTGIGIKPESHKTIFKRFSQEEKELYKNVGGLGLGLSIAKENVELLGGKISLKSEKGKGSTFFVTIPYKPENIDIKGDKLFSDKEIIPINHDKYVILIVEDEEINYLYLEILLKNNTKLNGTIFHAKNGKEAVEICKDGMVDFVLMDLKMPIMSGYEATKLIKEFLPKLPIVIQTAYSTDEEKEKAFLAGCDDFISKPIRAETLNSIIDKYLIMK